jgi:DNA-binding MarR family transcriptional regulator
MDHEKVNKIRAFNRFYTRIIGLLNKYLNDSQYTLPEVRVMYEIYHHNQITSKEITDLLSMDKSYLSRMLLSFDKKGLIKRKTDKTDTRAQGIALSAKGEKEFLAINKSTENQIADLLSGLNKKEVEELIVHMDGIQKILSKISN